MPSMPKRRVFVAKIKELGGLSALLERIADGETVKSVAASVGCSRAWLNFWLTRPVRKEAYQLARKESAAAMVEKAGDTIENAKVDRDSIAKAKLQAEHWRWLASRYDREQFGEVAPQEIAQSVGDLLLDALRRRAVPMERHPLTPLPTQTLEPVPALPAPAQE